MTDAAIALRAGAELAEHESPGPAGLIVIHGRVRLVAAGETVELGSHHVSPIPNRRHSLQPDEDSVVLLGVAVPDRAPA